MIIGIVRLCIYIFWIIPAAPIQFIIIKFFPKAAHYLPHISHKIFIYLFNIRIHQHGSRPHSAGLIVGNHVSWLDILVIGAALPVSFIAKSEISEWPVFGLLAKLQGSLFIDRKRSKHTGTISEKISSRITLGENIVLFAEGTSSNGVHVLPFHSSLIATDTEVYPLTLIYTARNGLPVGWRDYPAITWYGDMSLIPHIKDFLKADSIDVTLIWAKPVAGSHRKAVCTDVKRSVCQNLQNYRSGQLSSCSLTENPIKV